LLAHSKIGPSLFRERLEQIKREAESRACEHVNSLLETTRARLLEEDGDSSVILRLLMERRERAKPRHETAGTSAQADLFKVLRTTRGRLPDSAVERPQCTMSRTLTSTPASCPFLLSYPLSQKALEQGLAGNIEQVCERLQLRKQRNRHAE